MIVSIWRQYKWKILLVAIMVMMATGGGILLRKRLSTSGEPVTADAREIQPDRIVHGVPVYEVKPKELVQDIVIKGSIEAVNAVKIKAPGVRKWWRYRLTYLIPEGKIAKKGEVLARFDTAEIDKWLKDQKESLVEMKEREITMQEDHKRDLENYHDGIEKWEGQIRDDKEKNKMEIKRLKQEIIDKTFGYNEKKRQHRINIEELQDAVEAAKRTYELKKLSNLQSKYASKVEKRKLELETEAIKEKIAKAERKIQIARSENQIELKEYLAKIKRAKDDLKQYQMRSSRTLRLYERKLQQAKRKYKSRTSYLKRKHDRFQRRIKKKDDEIKKYEISKNEYEVRAPRRGLVLYRIFWHDGSHSPPATGDTIRRNYAFMSLPYLKKMKSVIRVNEIDIIKLKTGLSVDITLPSHNNARFNGVLKTIANVATKKKGEDYKRFNAEIFFDESDPRLRPGLSTVNRILIAKYKDKIVVPVIGVYFDQGKNHCFVQLGPKRYRKQPVVVGDHNINQTIIRSGLSEGDIISMSPPPKEFQVK